MVELKMKKIRLILSSFLNLILPKFCVNCQREGFYFCDDCLLFLSESNLICPVCQKSSYFGNRHKSCPKLNRLDGLVSFWDYDGSIKEAIHKIKYQGLFDVLEEVLEQTIYVFEKDPFRFSIFLSFLTDEKTLITFIPTNPVNYKERGFDQARLLADHLARTLKKSTSVLLKKNRNTKSQTGLNKEERFINVKDSFSFIPQGSGVIEKVLLVDDVWTSGATMQEGCRVLKNNGIKEVWGLTIAKA